MGRRQDSDLIVAHSSIALLQERFKQLEKMKEMREQRELLRLFPESERLCLSSSAHYNYKPSRRHTNPELSLSPPLQEKRNDYGDVKSLLSMNLWPSSKATIRTSNSYDNSEVDTSLHL